ncbi:MAG TPA: hypothetical protein VGX03_32840 [Candidatus Binatia bacterium]|jgi:hypothetical protein|nr:hypothetical protein [Candidatus Binatia bacterium]
MKVSMGGDMQRIFEVKSVETKNGDVLLKVQPEEIEKAQAAMIAYAQVVKQNDLFSYAMVFLVTEYPNSICLVPAEEEPHG